MTWSATQYSRFERERTRAVHDLLAGVPAQQVAHATDLGCGPGNSTQALLQRYPEAQVVGVDNDRDMLDKARARLPQARFELRDIAQWRPEGPQDLILANASLQWLPRHAQLYPKLVRQLREGGSLAVQTPDNLDEPAHRRLREIASRNPWAARFVDTRLPARHGAAFYYDLLAPLCSQVDIWRTTSHHPLPDADAVVQWFKGSALRPYLARLDTQEQEAFVQAYAEAIREDYPSTANGKVLLPFPRLFLVATR